MAICLTRHGADRERGLASQSSVSFLAATCLVLGIATSAQTNLLEGTELDLPRDVRVIEHAVLGIDQRNRAVIELVPDLVIGGSGADANSAFYRSYDVAVSNDGQIYVIDGGNDRVQVFSSEGRYLFTLGSSGQGPGEFVVASSITVAGTEVIVADVQKATLARWTLGGTFVSEERPGFTRFLRNITGFQDGTLLATHEGPDLREETLARVSADGNLIREYASFSTSSAVDLRPPGGGGRPLILSGTSADGLFAKSRNGDVYLANSVEYDIAALRPDGDVRWILRARWQTRGFTAREKDEIRQEYERRNPGAGAPVVEWPERLPALGALFVDGHGHLYVFPYTLASRGALSSREDWPVDVYSAAGELLFSGSVSRGWYDGDSLGDFIYTMDIDDETREAVMVRYRLQEPF